MSGSITSTNAVFTISVPSIFSIPVQLQEFSAEDIFTTQAVQTTETSMGLDGVLSGGKVFVPVPQTVSLQANSPSNAVFDQWAQQEEADGETYSAEGIIILKSLGKKWTMTNGFLVSYQPAPDAGKTLRPRRYGLLWNKMFPSNV